MLSDKKQKLLKFSNKNLNIFDISSLYIRLPKLQDEDIGLVKQFLDSFYDVEKMPLDFYRMFLFCLHGNKFNELFSILLKRNIYEMINFLKNDYEIDNGLEDIINPYDYFELPHKQIELIINMLNILDTHNNDILLKEKLSKDLRWNLRQTCINSKNKVIIIAIKMYLTIGFDNSIDLLSNKYGLVDYDIIYYLFNNLNTKSLNDNSINSFREFLFNNKKDDDNTMRLMLSGQLNDIFLNFSHFFNILDIMIDKLGSKLNRNKVELLLKEKYIASNLENPEVSIDVIDDMISSYFNRYGICEDESEILKKNFDAYNEKLKTKKESSIIKTNIPKINDYKFEMIPLRDIRNLVMGYRAGNCFRINGDASILFDIFLTNPHMRLLSISTDEYKDFGMVLLMRNGNTLIAQGIETSKRVPNEILGENLYLAVKQAINVIMDKMNEEDDEIVASIIGLTNNNTIPYNHSRLPFLVNPIIESNNYFYNGIDSYQGLLALKDGKTLNDIKLFTPKKMYHDNDNQIFMRNDQDYDSYNYREIEKILMSLRYARFKTNSQEETISYYNDLVTRKESYTICTYDWHITVFQDGSIDSFINSEDEEVINRYRMELDTIKQAIIKKKKK